MALKLYTLEEKIAAVEKVLDFLEGKDPVSKPLVAIAIDLKGRQDLPRSAARGEMERSLQRAVAGKDEAGNYTDKDLRFIANTVIQYWPTISQALEQFGEESAE